MRLVFVFLCLAPVLWSAPATPPPLEAFFERPVASSVQISPDGSQVAFLTPLEGRTGVAVMDLATGKSRPVARAGDEDIKAFFWKRSDHILFGSDVAGNESFAWHIINLANGKVRRVSESWGDNASRSNRGLAGQIVSRMRQDPERFLVFGNREEGDWTVGYYYESVKTGRRTAAPVPSDVGVRGTTFDSAGQPRLRNFLEKDERVYEVRVADGTWKPLHRRTADLLLDWRILGVTGDNSTAFVLHADEHDRGAVYPLDLQKGLMGPAILQASEGEIDGLVFSPDQRRILGLSYEGVKSRVRWLDGTMKGVQAAAEGLVPGMEVGIVDMSDDMKRFVIRVYSDRTPGGYFLFDMRDPAGATLKPLSQINPAIRPEDMQPMEPVVIRARDGLELHGYLTRPAGMRGKAPLVLNPHGGPYGVRDSWGFNPEVQFLASRGYAVLQVNYRGSGGYGRRFLEAGRLEWGAKMQDDLTDAVKWAVDQGIADPARVAIYGASYGGYTALAGAVFTPDLYACAVNYVGVSDLKLIARFSKSNQDRYMNQMFYDRWVHPDTAVLEARSPVNFVERIRIPTLHAYGENDPRVDIEHWTRLRAELVRHGRPFEELVEDQGHGFFDTKVSFRFYRALEAFLDRHLAPPGRVVVGEDQVLELPARNAP